MTNYLSRHRARLICPTSGQIQVHRVNARRTHLAHALVSVFLSARVASAAASTLDDIGVTQFRVDTNNAILGQGVSVGMPEPHSAGDTLFEINGVSAGVTVPLKFIYTNGSTILTTTTFNSSYHSTHADAVAAILSGVGNGVAPSLSQILNVDADLYVNYYVLNNVVLPNGPKVINQSFVLEATDPLFTPAILNQFFDNYVAQRHCIIVTAAGNGGDVLPPANAYNVIAVGAYQGISSVSQTGQLNKPDIVAPESYTSFATPYVSGVASLLVQVAGSGDATDPRVIKSLLLNGGTKPSGWTHSSTEPLDHTFGAGIVNADNSYHLLVAGEKSASYTTLTSSLGGAHLPSDVVGNLPASGWNLTTVSSGTISDAVDHYIIDLRKFTSPINLTATITWERANDQAVTREFQANANNPNFSNFTSSIFTINNLDLFLYDASTHSLVDLSNSSIDNVEQLYTLNLTPGIYDLQVFKSGGSLGTPNVSSDAETYAVVWSAIPVPEPATLTLIAAGAICLLHRRGRHRDR